MAQIESVNAIERAKKNDEAARRERDGANARRYNRPFSIYNSGIRLGIPAGVIIGILQIFVFGAEEGVNIGMGLLPYLIFIPFLWYGLSTYRKTLAGGEVFKNGIILGFYISVIGAITAALITLIGSISGLAIMRESGEELLFGNLAVYGFFQVLIGTVFGMLITFILLQGMKSDVPADEFIEQQEGHA